MKEEFLQQVEQFVSELLDAKLSPKNHYHNIEHTRKVVEIVSQIAQNENCNEQEILLLKIAAWFHDVGYIEQDEEHEEAGVKIFHNFLEKENIPEADVTTVEKLILATKMGEAPTGKLEKIIKDADCAHVAFQDFFETTERLRLELESKKEQKLPKYEWMVQNKGFLSKHKFYTKYAQQKWNSSKEINKLKLEEKIKNKKEKKANKSGARKIGKGVETMFRVTLKNHIELSAIADTKANILLSVNAIIISVALSNLIPKLDNESNAFLIYPTLIFMTFSVVSVVLSVLSTRPNISSVTVTKEMIKNNNTNILFFGNFYKMSLKDFEWGIDYLIDNEETLYNSLTKDLYYLGLVLERKYRLLRMTYTVFMIGIVVSALSFVASYHFFVNAA